VAACTLAREQCLTGRDVGGAKGQGGDKQETKKEETTSVNGRFTGDHSRDDSGVVDKIHLPAAKVSQEAFKNTSHLSFF
jgi:hypothetical protein